MLRPTLAAALALALAASGCAAPAPLVRRARPASPPSPRAARFEFASGNTDFEIERVTRAMPAGGLRLAERDALKVVTEPRERDVRCGASTCLAREVVRVKFGWKRAALRLDRWIWIAATRSWEQPRDPDSLEDIEREQELLVRDLRRPHAAPPGPAFRTTGDPSAPVASAPGRVDGGAGGG